MNVRRLTRADVAIGISVLLLIAAATGPMFGARAHRSLVEQAVIEIDLLRAAALDRHSTTGNWPDATPAGQTPSALSAAYAGRVGFTFDDFAIEWASLDVIEYVEAPPANLTVIADDEEPDTSVPPSGAIGDLPPDSVGPLMAPSVREIGAIVVHTGNESLLADLLNRYGSTVSYVRDTTWTLVVDDRAGSSP